MEREPVSQEKEPAIEKNKELEALLISLQKELDRERREKQEEIAKTKEIEDELDKAKREVRTLKQRIANNKREPLPVQASTTNQSAAHPKEVPAQLRVIDLAAKPPLRSIAVPSSITVVHALPSSLPRQPKSPYAKKLLTQTQDFLHFVYGAQPLAPLPRHFYATITEDKPCEILTENLEADVLKYLKTEKGNSLANAFIVGDGDTCPLLKVVPPTWDALIRLEDWFQSRAAEYSLLQKIFEGWNGHKFTSRDLIICMLPLLQPYDRQLFIQRLKLSRTPVPLFHFMLESNNVKSHLNWMKFATAFREPCQFIINLGTKGTVGKSFLLPYLFVDAQNKPTIKTNGQSGVLHHYSADVCFALLDQRNVAIVDVHSSKMELSSNLLSLILAIGHKFVIHVSRASFIEGQPTVETDSIFKNVPKEHALVYWRDWEDRGDNEDITEYLFKHASSVFKLKKNIVTDLEKSNQHPETLAVIDDARKALNNLCISNTNISDFWGVHNILKQKHEYVGDEITIETAPKALEDLHNQLTVILAAPLDTLSELFPYSVIYQANSKMDIGTKELTTWDLNNTKVTNSMQVDALTDKWKELHTGSLSHFMTLFKNTLVKQDIEGLLEFNQQCTNATISWGQYLVSRQLKLYDVWQLISSDISNQKKFSEHTLDEHSKSAKLLLDWPMDDIKKEWEKKKNSTLQFWQVVAHWCFTELKDIVNRFKQENISLELCWRELILYYNICKPNDSVDILKGFVSFIQAGFPLELLNGNTGAIHERPFLSDLLASLGNEDVKVISIFGLHSSGKSTLLNYLFGSQFAVSVGRCTRGMNISYVNASVGKHKGVLVVDTEGFLAVERGHRHFDVQMALLLIACSNTVMINMAKNSDELIGNILSAAIHCFHHLRINTSHSPTIKIVIRDAIEQEKSANIMKGQKIKQKLLHTAAGLNKKLKIGDISIALLPPGFVTEELNEVKKLIKKLQYAVTNVEKQEKEQRPVERVQFPKQPSITIHYSSDRFFLLEDDTKLCLDQLQQSSLDRYQFKQTSLEEVSPCDLLLHFELVDDRIRVIEQKKEFAKSLLTKTHNNCVWVFVYFKLSHGDTTKITNSVNGIASGLTLPNGHFAEVYLTAEYQVKSNQRDKYGNLLHVIANKDEFKQKILALVTMKATGAQANLPGIFLSKLPSVPPSVPIPVKQSGMLCENTEGQTLDATVAHIKQQGNITFSNEVKILRSELLAEDSSTQISKWGDAIKALCTNFSIFDVCEKAQRSQSELFTPRRSHQFVCKIGVVDLKHMTNEILQKEVIQELNCQMEIEAGKLLEEGDDIEEIFQQLWEKVAQQIPSVSEAQNVICECWRQFAQENNSLCSYSTNLDVTSCHLMFEKLIESPNYPEDVKLHIADKKFVRVNSESAWNSAWTLVYNWLCKVKQQELSSLIFEESYNAISKIITAINSNLLALASELKKASFDLLPHFHTMIHMEFVHCYATKLHKAMQADTNCVLEVLQSQRQQIFILFQGLVIKNLTRKFL